MRRAVACGDRAASPRSPCPRPRRPRRASGRSSRTTRRSCSRASPKRIDTLNEDQGARRGHAADRVPLERDHLRSARKTKPSFDAANPAPTRARSTPSRASASTTTSSSRAHAMGFRIIGTITGRRSALGDRRRQGRSFATANYKVNASDYAQFAEAVARRYAGNFWRPAGDPLLHDLERAEPQAVPEAAARRARRSTVSWSKRACRPIRRGAVSGAKVFVGRDGAVGGRRQVDRAARLPAEVALPEQALEEGPQRQLPTLQESHRGRLCAPPLRAPRARCRASGTRSASA